MPQEAILYALLIWLLVGAIIGWLASQIMITGGFGVQGDFIVGVVGGLLGGLLFHQLEIFRWGYLGAIVSSVVGAVIATFVGRLMKRYS